MEPIDRFSEYDSLTLGILSKRWAPDADSSNLRDQGDRCDPSAYRRYIDAHGLGGILLRYHASDLENWLGEPLAEGIRRDYLKNAFQNAKNISCIQSIFDSLGESKIDWVMLKGVALSLQLYGDSNIRSSSDVDVMVNPDDVEPAIEALKKADFRLCDATFPTGTARRWLYRKSMHHCSLKSSSGVVLELHWRSDFSPELSLKPLAGLKASIGSVATAGIVIPCLQGPVLTIHIARHAYRSLWLRWKWLYDVVELYLQSTEAAPHLRASLLLEPSIAVSIGVAESLLRLEPGTLSGHPAQAVDLKRILRLRDLEVLRFQFDAGLAPLTPQATALMNRVPIDHIRFQAQAIAQRSARASYLAWRLVRPLMKSLADSEFLLFR